MSSEAATPGSILGAGGSGVDLEGLGELGIVARIRALGLARPEGVVRGIGDDAAVFRIGEGRVAVVTTDILLEGVHFRLARSDHRALGAKALAVNLSDIAAMGARPREAFLALAAPPGLDVAVLDTFLGGFDAECRAHGVNLLGGDTSASPQGLVVSVTVVGDAAERSVIWRSGARDGDGVFVTGTLGDAAAGLLVLERGLAPSTDERRAVVRAHERPRAFVAEGQWLAGTGAATAMIDLSDGLATDLGHIVAESGVPGALVEAERLPTSGAALAVCRDLGEDPVELALAGGEDYRLLVVLRPDREEAIARDYEACFGAPLTRVGRIDGEAGLRLARDGHVRALVARGYEHFRGDRAGSASRGKIRGPGMSPR